MNPRRSALLVAAFVAWTVFVWTTRIRNVVGDDDASSATRATAIVTSVALIALAAAVAVALMTRRLWLRESLMAMGALTVAVWLVRGTGIVVGDRSVAFKVVHVVLALISIALAFATWPRRRVPA